MLLGSVRLGDATSARPLFAPASPGLQAASSTQASVTVKSEPAGVRVYVGKKSSDAAANKSYFEALTAPPVGESGQEPTGTEGFFKGVTPLTIPLSPGSYRISLRTPPSYDQGLLGVWRNTVPQGMRPSNLVARGSCTDFPQLFLGRETECIMYFGKLDLEWVAKEYSLEVGGNEPQEFSVIFQKFAGQ